MIHNPPLMDCETEHIQRACIFFLRITLCDAKGTQSNRMNQKGAFGNCLMRAFNVSESGRDPGGMNVNNNLSIIGHRVVPSHIMIKPSAFEHCAVYMRVDGMALFNEGVVLSRRSR